MGPSGVREEGRRQRQLVESVPSSSKRRGRGRSSRLAKPFRRDDELVVAWSSAIPSGSRLAGTNGGPLVVQQRGDVDDIDVTVVEMAVGGVELQRVVAGGVDQALIVGHGVEASRPAS